MVKILPNYNAVKALCEGKSEKEKKEIVRKALIEALEKL